MGKVTTSHPFKTLWWNVLSYQSIQTLSWYLFSAWWFGEVYIWSAPRDAALGWVEKSKYVELLAHNFEDH